MEQYIPKSALVAEIEKLKCKVSDSSSYCNGWQQSLRMLELSLDTLEVKDQPTAYVVTRCEEHSDYVEEVFFDEDMAQAYCDQFKGNENEYARHITKVKVTL